jgi:electron transfer flavoprotein-quinone oxidoreductase
MSVDEKFDAIIVGAGPAGSACAYTLAKAGKSVLMIERGNTPGSKNITGGRVYTYALELLEPGIWEEAALERRVTHEQMMMINKEQTVKIDFSNPAYNPKGYLPQSFTVLRAVFDEWLAAKAEERGVILACGIKVDDIIVDSGRVVGVKAGADEMFADVVIAADGVNSLIAQKAGLFKDIEAQTVGVGVKEVIELPAKTIEERFNLRNGEGTALLILGCTEGIHGGGFLYTNKESISLGCVFTPTEVTEKKRQIHDIFQDLKMHPGIYPLLEGGQTVEYGAHLVREAGFRGIPQKLYKDGLIVIGEAAGFVINVGYSIRGIDLAIVSGIAAAQAVISGKELGSAYMTELANLKLLPSMKAVDSYFELLEISRLYSTYPKVATNILDVLFRVDGKEPPAVKNEMMKILKENKLSMWQLLKDGLRGFKSI